MTAKLLLTGPHVERALTLLALMATAANKVELDRYSDRLATLRRQHPEVAEITEADPRIPGRITSIEESFAVGGSMVDVYCACGVLCGKRLASRTDLPPVHCHNCAIKRMFTEAATR